MVWFLQRTTIRFHCITSVTVCAPWDTFVQFRKMKQSVPLPLSGSVQLDFKVLQRVELSEQLQQVSAGWVEVFKDCFAVKCTSDVYLDITSCLPEKGCRFRTTMILDNGVWELVEFGQDISELAMQSGPIPAIEEPVEVLTLAHVYRRKPEQFGLKVIFDEDEPPAVASSSKPDVVVEDVAVEEKQQHEFSRLSPEAEVSQHDRPRSEVADHVTVDGERLTAESTVKALREACGKCSIGQSGGKKVLFNRLAHHVQAMDSLAKVKNCKLLRASFVSAGKRKIHGQTRGPSR